MKPNTEMGESLSLHPHLISVTATLSLIAFLNSASALEYILLLT
jgi:hypothetical protein